MSDLRHVRLAYDIARAADALNALADCYETASGEVDVYLSDAVLEGLVHPIHDATVVIAGGDSVRMAEALRHVARLYAERAREMALAAQEITR